ncbi:ABC transporter permease [Aliikangiella coralliicola]|uniref:FtsX-like permease family protein n=1 Tax=Aliikangiella coralliicola TaxID=2592383 RepID=A0A545UGG4_9GAMM|nr:ABC transporter permease [Aliikangiella coralliicola]TQV88566.1 FtsX-like permease family protein [Aliikangiella coralliicola]
MFIKLALKSLLNRKGSVVLTLMAMTISVFVLLAVEHIRYQAKENFAKTVSGVDLIVGARTGSLNLLLYSVFRIGSPTNNIAWESFKQIANNPQVKWAIPITLGDSHKGYRVMGTTKPYFEYFSYGNQHKLKFDQGSAFNQVFDVVLGSDVAKELGYSTGDAIILSHGLASTSFSLHDDRPFTVTGILEPTGTPVDQTLHVSLEGIEAIHINWRQGVKMPGNKMTEEQIEQLELKPKSVTALMLGLKSRMATFHVQREINQSVREPLLAILPGVALSELWQMMNILENTLLLVAILVFVAALLGLSAMLLSSIRYREAEIRLLRVVGAPSVFLFFLIQIETLMITIVSLILGAGILAISLAVAQDFLISRFGLPVSSNILSESAAYYALGIIAASIVIAIIPSLKAYSKAKINI